MKNKIRKIFLERRREISNKESKDNKIIKNLNSLYKIKKSKIIHSYISKNEEVNTFNIIQNLLKKGKKIIVPISLKEKFSNVILESLEKLKKGNLGILEPIEKNAYEGPIDTVIVPGVAFDKEGNRLGRGKGSYDKFLKEQSAFKIGLAYEEQIIEKLPTEPHDIKMDYLITEKRIIKCGK